MTKPIPRYLHRQTCIIDNCTQEIVTCTKILQDGQICGQKGHPDYYKSNEQKIVLVVKHTHFLPLSMQDTGRNDFHNIKKIKAPSTVKIKTWKTDRTGDRMRRIPDEVRENLGWNDDK